jgi:Zn-dependent protease with chaperone function
MAQGLKYYPPGPQDLPYGISAPPPKYWIYSVVVLFSLLAFLVIYVGLVIGSAYLVYLSVMYPMEVINRFTIALKLGAIGCSIMLFLFFVRALFKVSRPEVTGLLEVEEREQPELYAFIRRLCREIGAPFPYRIYLSPEVQASVFFDRTSLLSLILPTRKNLVIGLGLVNALNITEFKAVLAHEFGHFSQGTMALGNYVYVAGRTVHDLVGGRDRWDDWLDEAREMTWQVAIFAWLFSGVIWVIRQFLRLLYGLLNLGRFALDRQMEFHADRMAVRATGSDAIVHALCRISFAYDCYREALAVLGRGLGHQTFTRDFYFHQTRAGEGLRAQADDPRLGVPPPLPADPSERTRVFLPTKEDPPSLWHSHPTLTEREENAKRIYVRSEGPTEPAWVLFPNAAVVKERVTQQIYLEVLETPAGFRLGDPEKLDALVAIDRESERSDPRYGDLYRRRLIGPGDVEALARQLAQRPLNPAQMKSAWDRVYAGGAQDTLARRKELQEEEELLEGVLRGHVKGKRGRFEFRGEQRKRSEAETLHRQVEIQLKQIEEELHQLDRDAFCAHYQMAAALSSQSAGELLARYRFHLNTQELFKELGTQLHTCGFALMSLAEAGRATEEEIKGVAEILTTAQKSLAAQVAKAEQMRLPPLSNLEAGAPLRSFLQPGPVLEPPPLGNFPPDEWIDALMPQLNETAVRAQQVVGKSLAAILALQERIAGEYQARAARA